jgi:predicted ArsR family transcriptional regulator
MTFDEACRRAYNKRRRLIKQRRILTITKLQTISPQLTGRELARIVGVHEATVSRDLKFLERVRDEYREMCGEEMRPHSFRFLRRGQGHEITFEMRDGVRIK